MKTCGCNACDDMMKCNKQRKKEKEHGDNENNGRKLEHLSRGITMSSPISLQWRLSRPSFCLSGRKRQFPTTFMNKSFSHSDGNNDISSRKELEVYPPCPPTALLSILAISRALMIQMLWNFMGDKIRWLSTTFMNGSMSFHPAKVFECCCPPSPLNQ